MDEGYRKIAQPLFEKIRTEFGDLEASFSANEPYVSVALDFEE
jgi:hypothetical protein